MNHIHLEHVHSTNSYLKDWIEREPSLPSYTMVTAHEQTAGRGQKGNHWEAAPGLNLTLSLLLRPSQALSLAPFDLNIVTSLVLTDILHPLIPSVEIKWPNDILVGGTRKIAGILTENTWIGNEWDYSVVGIGLNVCQTTFQPYHPIATSMALERCEVPENWHQLLLEQIADGMKKRLEALVEHPAQLRQEYHDQLYKYLVKDTEYLLPDGTPFIGTMIGVQPNGLLDIREIATGKVQSFAFKQICFK